MPSAAQETLASPSPRNGWKLVAAGYVLLIVARLLRRTYRIRVFGGDHRKQAEAHHAQRSFCLALWHEHLFGSIMAHAGQPFAPLASLSSDGDLVAFVMDRLGFRTVRGSSSRRGEEARHELVDVVQHGYFTAITMDGPRGPRRRVKGGIIDVARRSGVAVLPVITLSDRAWILTRSWDQFKIPKPFARVAVRYGPPLVVDETTVGLAFGDAKAAVRRLMAETETAAEQDLAAWRGSL